MTTFISQQPGLPGYEYSRRLDRQDALSPEDIVRSAAHEAAFPAEVNATVALAKIRGWRLADYAAWRVRVGLTVAWRRGGLSDRDKVQAACAALVVAALCAWMFWNANFAQP